MTNTEPDLKARLRGAVQKLRRTPMPIADVAPMLQEAADMITTLQSKLAQEQADYRSKCAELELVHEQLDAALERVRKLEKDAARYRWLRDISVPPHNFYLSVPVEFDGVRYTREQVDAAIDAALAKETP